jgi:hypothetical protein
MTDEANQDPIIRVRLKKGLADRHRVPLADVLSVLDELRLMIAEVGRKIQKARGMANPNGDFGLELVGGEHGTIFRKGSIEMDVAITMNSVTGILATQEVLRTFDALESENGVPEPDRPLDRRLLRRMSRVARVQRRDRMELEVGIYRPGFDEPYRATFGRAAMDTLKALQTPSFQVEGVSLYGKLIVLADHDLTDETDKGFWGELIRSDGETWRVQFRSGDNEAVNKLFRQQVHITGKAVYYRVATPKIVVETIELDTERDYESAFDELFGSYKKVFNSDLKTLIKQMREE